MLLFLTIVYEIAISNNSIQPSFAQQVTNFQKYVNSTSGITMDYPTSYWIKKEGLGHQNVVTFYSTADEPVGYTISGSRDLHAVAIFEYNLPVINAHQKLSLRDYASLKLNDLEDMPLIKIKGIYDNATLSNQQAYKIEYTYSDANLSKYLHFMDFLTVRDNKAYEVVYLNNYLNMSDLANTDYYPVIMHMIDSFKIESAIAMPEFPISLLGTMAVATSLVVFLRRFKYIQ